MVCLKSDSSKRVKSKTNDTIQLLFWFAQPIFTWVMHFDKNSDHPSAVTFTWVQNMINICQEYCIQGFKGCHFPFRGEKCEYLELTQLKLLPFEGVLMCVVLMSFVSALVTSCFNLMSIWHWSKFLETLGFFVLFMACGQQVLVDQKWKELVRLLQRKFCETESGSALKVLCLRLLKMSKQ